MSTRTVETVECDGCQRTARIKVDGNYGEHHFTRHGPNPLWLHDRDEHPGPPVERCTTPDCRCSGIASGWFARADAPPTSPDTLTAGAAA